MIDEIQPGFVIAGKYRVENLLGRGGMGFVMAATHLQLDERVAIKFLLDRALDRPDAVRRFAREARVAAKLKSEHVARVIDAGVLGSGTPYIVMECLEGDDLEAHLARRQRLPVAEAAEILVQVCEALAEAHALGVVHRDLKPANLFLTRRRDGSLRVKVLDFGVSKVALSDETEADRPMTTTSSIVGSPHYMSPEQLSAPRDVDARTDIWALGAVLYKLVTGRVPFDAPTLPQLCTAILHSDPLPPRELLPELSRGFQALIVRCLDKRPSGRFHDVAELAVALSRFAPSGREAAERSSKILRSSWSRTAPDGSDGGAAVRPGSSPPSSRSRNTAVVIASLLAGVAAVGAWTWVGHDAASSLPSPDTRRPGATASQPAPLVLPRSPAEPGPLSRAEGSPSVAGNAAVVPSSSSQPVLAPASGSAVSVRKRARAVVTPPAATAGAPATSASSRPPQNASPPSPLEGRR